ncbi:YrhB domain-containing protein [Streptomyces sp. NPDC127098]|uniref:YrhB domain-containing protein n=1 Tax=Streptomyces sp. NPDC127098 TaxID=3347137 RepID=UPI003658A3A9
MISQDEAMRIALEYLQNVYRNEQYTFVMQPELTQGYRTVWAVRFDTQEHLDTGDFTKAPMTRVLLVPKDGSTPWWPPSAWSVSEFEAQLGPRDE